MSKATVDRTRSAVFANPIRGGLPWREVETMLDVLGAGKAEMGGSTVAFTLGTVRAVFDRPHPRRECGIGLVKRVRQFLINAGHAPEGKGGRS